MRAALGFAARAAPPGWHAVRRRLESPRRRGVFPLASASTATVPTSGMSSSPSPPDRPPLRGVIFDMDGTLTVPNHDFKRMYERVGCVTSDILTEIDTWEPARRERAEAIIHEMETEALVGMRVMPHASSLGAFLDERDVPRGLVTRNVSASVDHFHAEHWGRPEFGHERSSKQDNERRSTSVSSSGSFLGLKPFSPALARDFRPFKPAPDALLHICAAWGVPPSACAMVGDSAKDDVVAGNRAGCVTILLDTQGKWRVEGVTSADEPRGNDGEVGDDNGVAIGKETGDDVLRGEMVPTHVVRCLSEIAPLLERHYEIVGR